MKILIVCFVCLMISTMCFGQKKMFIHKTDHVTMGVSILATDSVIFSADGYTLYFYVNSGMTGIYASSIDSI